MTRRVLVAGVGNIFQGDDGFGVAVARRLTSDPDPLPEGSEVADFGIRGIHLAYQLLEGYDTLILVDTLAQGGDPGTVYLMEPDLASDDEQQCHAPDETLAGAHDMDPRTVLRTVTALGGRIGRVLVVGCEPADLGDRIGLSETVEGAVGEAVQLVRSLLRESATAAPDARRSLRSHL